jgi:hypothetical protein
VSAAQPGSNEGGVKPVVLAVGRGVLTSALLIVAYILLPLRAAAGAPLLFFVIGAVLFAASLTYQLRAIATSNRPGLRAIESVGLLLPFIVIVFASTYLIESTIDPHAFSQTLDRVSAVYFAVTTLSTVGFGDIVPVSDPARLLVTAQMLVDLVLVAAVIRLIVSAVARARARNSGSDVS